MSSPTMTPRKPRIIIAGGSVAGLTLANILEKLGFDYVVLEGYPEIAPQVGASIALVANGLRILDQIGCYSDVRALIDEPMVVGYLRDSDGTPLLKSLNVVDHVTKRHGYPIIFIDRQMVLKVLYDNLKDKSQVKVNKKVVEVELLDQGVQVRTKDGDTFTGDILVGADGIHSTVRNEMWRLSEQLEPGYIPSSEHSAMPCDYKCIFGISVMKDFEALSSHKVLNEHFSYLILTGPDFRVYWFLFVNLGKTYYGKDIPRFSKEDEDKVVEEHRADRITDTMTFGDIYQHRISSVLTALPEYSFKKWHFNRIITIGDSVHKFEPISGQGGNSAIETAATLVNELMRMMQKHPEGLSTADIHSAFAETQAIRESRVWELIRAANTMQRIEAMETSIFKFLARYVLPKSTMESQIDLWTTTVVGATRIEALETPKRSHFVRWDDELTCRPLSSRWMWLSRIVMAAVFLGMVYMAQDLLQLSPDDLPQSFCGTAPKKVYTGIQTVDSVLTVLALAFSGVVGTNRDTLIQQAYFLVMLMPVAFNWTLEAYRVGNSRSPTTWAVIFGILYQLLGIGRIAPIYFLLSLYTTATPILSRPSGRPVPTPVAKALLPATIIGFVIPTVAMFLPLDDMALRQSTIALWQPFPIYVAILTWTIAGGIEKAQGKQWTIFDMYDQKDVAPLQAGYAFVFCTTAVMHMMTLFYVMATPSAAVGQIFWNVASSITEPYTALNLFWKNDMVLYFASVIVWCLYSVFELRRLGYITTQQALKAGLVVMAGQVVVGPAAVYAGLWHWREGVISEQAITWN